MRVLRHLLWSSLASILLVGIAPAAAQADETHPHHGPSCPARHRTASQTKVPDPLEQYYHGDWRLGPSYLPKSGRIGRMLRGYRPQDSTSRTWFLGCYWQANPQPGAGWWFPDNNGFLLHHGRPVERPLRLHRGQLVDLFGSGTGHFLAPAGTPYAKRALPPSNLDEYAAAAPPLSYHLYRVRRPFTVQAGPIRPWFGQPGLGLQYYTGNKAIPDLTGDGHLRALN
jgi:hypothetical protein